MTPTDPIQGLIETLMAILTTLFMFFADFFRQGLAAFLF